MSDTKATGGRVITATLVQGKIYTFHFDGQYYQFQRNVPKEVTPALASELEALTKEVYNSDGESYEKELFKIDWDASARPAVPTGPKKLRMRIVPVEEREDDKPKRTGGIQARRAPKGLRAATIR
jgi:hypothetical protein